MYNYLRPINIAPPRVEDDAYAFVEPEIRELWANGARSHLNGFIGGAVEHWSAAMQKQLYLSKRLGVAQDFRYFGPVWTGVIGHIGHLTALIQAKQLNMYNAKKIVIDATYGSANPSYLEYLKEFCEVITDRSRLDALDLRFKAELPAVVQIEKNWLFLIDAIRLIQERWVAQGRDPLFQLSQDHKRKGEALLREWGLPDDAWFVTLHVREQGKISGGSSVDSIRNCSIEDYVDSIRSVTDRGGWVIRIGGSDYQPLPEMKNVIDYATKRPHQDWVDIYFLAAARFVIATNSGPPWVAVSFGVPVLFTNWAPRGINLFWPGCTVLYKTLIDQSTGREVPLRQQMEEPISQIESLSKLRSLGLNVRPNSSNEIKEATDKFIGQIFG